MSIYITGDVHRDFDRLFLFCEKTPTTREDVMIILGDAGINYYLSDRDRLLKEELSNLPLTLFCIHGNHEERPFNLPGYQEQEWHGGKVYVEPDFPNLIFAKDGEIYDFDGKQYIVIGGAYSVDKHFRQSHGWQWFASEQPDETIKAYVEQQLDKVHWTVDGVLSHTVPLDYEPTWAFLSGIDQSRVDKSTEIWLGTLEKKLHYRYWFAGHYHVESQEGPITLFFESVKTLAQAEADALAAMQKP